MVTSCRHSVLYNQIKYYDADEANATKIRNIILMI